jgi:hypothetical protein
MCSARFTDPFHEALVRVDVRPHRGLVVLVLEGRVTDRAGRRLGTGNETLTDLRKGRLVRAEIRTVIFEPEIPRRLECSVAVSTATALISPPGGV